jgi:hypothetical protein
VSAVYNCCWSSPAWSFLGPSLTGLVTIFYCLGFETPPTCWERFPYSYHPGTGWPSFTPRHWVFFSSPPTTRHRLNSSANCLQDNSSARTTQKTQPLYCCRDMFTASLNSNSRGVDHIENTVLLLLRALPSNDLCLQGQYLAMGLYAQFYIGNYAMHTNFQDISQSVDRFHAEIANHLYVYY